MNKMVLSLLEGKIKRLDKFRIFQPIASFLVLSLALWVYGMSFFVNY